MDAHHDDSQRFIFRLGDLFDGRRARLALAFLVLVSLLPLGSLDLALRPVFILCFGVELAVRFLVWRADVHGTRSLTTGDVMFAVVDTLAFISFLPLELWLEDRELLTGLSLLRLSRLFMLLRFGRGLARDLYAIVTRREQVQTLAFVTGAVLVLSLVSAIVLSHLAVRVSEQPDEPFRERFWWAFRQLESADNLVTTLEGDPVLIGLSIVLTIAGVFLIAFVIGVGSNVVDQLVRAERRRDLAYAGHTVIVGAVHEGEELIREFVRIYAKNRQVPSPERLLAWLRYMRPHGTRTFPRVALLARRDDMPDFLVEPIMRWVVYRQGDESEPESLRRVAANQAKRAIFLTQRHLGLEADAATVSALAALRGENPDCQAYVEVDDPEARDIVLQVGGPHTVALDVPRFLGMFLCQHLLMPGVESLYRDLLTADGTEIYTHLFTDAEDQAALARLPETLSFDDIAAAGARVGVVVLGVYLGAEPVRRNRRGVVVMDGLQQWLNPADDVRDDALTTLGAQRGRIPTRSLRGIIGIAESYLPLRSFAAAVVRGDLGSAPVGVDGIDAIDRALQAPRPGPLRVALIGASDSLPSLLRELALFVPGVDVQLFLSSRGGERTPLGRRLEALGVGVDSHDPLPGIAGRRLTLPRGGALQIFTHDAPDLARFAAERLREAPPVEAAVFLCEAEGSDRDARTAMRVLRFLRMLEDGTVPRGERLHLVAEFLSVDKGTYLQRHVDVRRCGFASVDDLRLTLIARETIKSYFMVHSSFVPGVSAIYDELLEERGQDVVRFVWRGTEGTVSWGGIVEALRRRGAIAIALERRDRSVALGLGPDAVIPAADIAGVYAVAESAALATAP
jgi:hypothetical protein